jgi:hypothetical protein
MHMLLVLVALAVLLASIALAVLQRYVASFISLLAGVIVLSYPSELRHEEGS